jgi:hypothetical protein
MDVRAPDQGFEVASAGGLVAPGGGVPRGVTGAGLAALPSPDGAALDVVPLLAAGVRGLGTVLLCFGASGSTNGPFWPHPAIMPAKQTGIQRRAILIPAVYRRRNAAV